MDRSIKESNGSIDRSLHCIYRLYVCIQHYEYNIQYHLEARVRVVASDVVEL
jgi:hypothetical protein